MISKYGYWLSSAQQHVAFVRARVPNVASAKDLTQNLVSIVEKVLTNTENGILLLYDLLTARRKGFKAKLKRVHLEAVNMWMTKDPEATAEAIQRRLAEVFNVTVSRGHICRIRRQLGWTAKRARYCQLITTKNKLARTEFCLKALIDQEDFEDVIFTDETSIELSANGTLFFYQRSSQFDRLPSKVSKPKHSYKVHMWAGISYRGRTHCCLFTGIMDSLIYQQILRDNLLPFTRSQFPEGYRLYQDNDSKHKSKSTMEWMEENDVLDKLMPSPASSPDLNPIENVWATLKDHLKRKVKPRTKDALVKGIKDFWEALTSEQCGRYIDHIHRVIPQVVLNKGGPTVF